MDTITREQFLIYEEISCYLSDIARDILDNPLPGHYLQGKLQDVSYASNLKEFIFHFVAYYDDGEGSDYYINIPAEVVLKNNYVQYAKQIANEQHARQKTLDVERLAALKKKNEEEEYNTYTKLKAKYGAPEINISFIPGTTIL